jgi:hypothetical protein
MTHPCTVPYEDPPDEQKAKDILFLGIVAALSGFSRRVFTEHSDSTQHIMNTR